MNGVFAVHAAISQAGSLSRANEDAWGHTANAVWVVDGATGVEVDRICPGRTDAAWFAGEMSAQLATTRQDCSGVVEAMETALAGVRRTLVRDGVQLPRQWLGPTASIAVAVTRIDEIEVGILGDCRVIEVRIDGTVVTHGSSRIYELDQDLTEAVHQIRQRRYPEGQRTELIAKLESDLRSLANCEDGYWILDLSGSGIPFTQVIRLKASPIASLILVTDGVYRLVDTYSEHDDEAFARMVLRSGPRSILGRLRSIERQDPHCRRFKRVKAQDDATLVVVGGQGKRR